MVFYGESYPIWDGSVLSPVGATFPFDETYYHFEGGSHVWSAGDVFVVNIDPATLNLEATSDAVASFVIEALAGSSGTLRLHYGMDPTYATDDSYATISLGDYTVTGLQTVVSTQTAITAAQLYAGDESPILKVEILAGSVDITQVKLRVWPPGGASGAWTTAPEGYTTTRQGTLWRGSIPGRSGLGASGETATAQAAIDEAAPIAAADLVTSFGTTSQWNLNSGGTRGSTSGEANPFGDPVDHWNATVNVSLAYSYLLATSYPIPTPQVENAGSDPRELWFEDMAMVRSVDGGPPVPGTFGGWTGTVSANGSNASDPTQISPDQCTLDVVSLPGYPDLTQTNSTSAHGPWTLYSTGAGPAIPDGANSLEVALTGGPHLALCITPPGALSGSITMGTHPEQVIASATMNLPDKTYLVQFGPYTYFDPTLPWVPERQPRFFVKDLEDEWVPVGFGKPADELRLFYVPTAMGFWRDLTVAEYAAYTVGEPPVKGRYALKVKRDDGTMDIVALMVPRD